MKKIKVYKFILILVFERLINIHVFERLINIHGLLYETRNNTLQSRQLDCECGVKHRDKIVGGNPTKKNEYPWMVLICYGTPCNQFTFFCGGSLINDLFVLTAAHCMEGESPGNIFMSIGDHHILVTTETTSEERGAVEIIINPFFDSPTLRHDLALIKLDQPVLFSTKINPICITRGGRSYTNQKATVTGWGDTTEGGQTSRVLREVKVKVISNKSCIRDYEYKRTDIFKKMMCAFAPGKDSCQGDSGGPLILKQQGHYEQIGIVSFGFGCARPEYPGVYTRVSYYNDWIIFNANDGQWCNDPRDRNDAL